MGGNPLYGNRANSLVPKISIATEIWRSGAAVALGCRYLRSPIALTIATSIHTNVSMERDLHSSRRCRCRSPAPHSRLLRGRRSAGGRLSPLKDEALRSIIFLGKRCGDLF